MKKIILSAFLSILFVLISSMPVSAQVPQEEFLEGEIVEVNSKEKIDPLGDEYLVQEMKVDIYKGSLEGDVIDIENDTISIVSAQEYSEGDKVVVMYTKDYEGNDLFYITDYVRKDGLLLLFAAFVFLTILIGGFWGATSLVGMAFSFLIIFKIVLPMIMAGNNAVLSAIVGSAIIIPVTFSLSHGFKMKTLIASVGTVITLVITGLIAAFAVEITYLTGFGSEEASFLSVQLGETINMKGLLLAGMIISSLGILDDITISQASVVAELRSANKKLKMSGLFTRAMNVGRDHIASLVNTLVLVYAGSSLPLLLLFLESNSPFSEVVNIELIADEIVRTLVGSMGLILAVPITTILAAYYYLWKGKTS